MPIVVGRPRSVNVKNFRSAALMSLALVTAVLPGSVAVAAPDSTSGSGAAVVDRTVHVLVQRKGNSGGTDRVRSHGANVRHDLRTANLVAAEVPASRLDELAR